MSAHIDQNEHAAKPKEQNREIGLLNLAQLALALVALAVAGWTAAVSQFRAGIDDLFLFLTCLLVAAMAMINPTLWAYSNGYFDVFFNVKDEPETSAHDHHNGLTTNLSVMVWVALLGLTGFEVFLAYIHLSLTLMLIILMGASIIKAALIMAYFMHLRFERMTLILTLVPAMVVCIALLTIIFPDSVRLATLRELLR